jgi:transcriptional regulator with XRE-family HTH domain
LWLQNDSWDVPTNPRRTRKDELDPKRAFGVVLRQLRTKRGYSQDSFAHHTGYHRNYIGQLERGEKSPSLNALFVLSRAFDLVPSEILKDVERLLVAVKN